MMYYVIDNTFGDSVILSCAMPYEEACDFLQCLRATDDGGVYKLILA